MSSRVVACMSPVDVYTSIFTNVLMACTLMIMPVISWSLFSVRFWDNQSAIYRSEPGLYMMYTLYW